MTVGGAVCTGATWVSVNQLTCVTPPGSGSARDVGVTIADRATPPGNGALAYEVSWTASSPASAARTGGNALAQGPLASTDADGHAYLCRFVDANSGAHLDSPAAHAASWTFISCVAPAWSASRRAGDVRLSLDRASDDAVVEYRGAGANFAFVFDTV